MTLELVFMLIGFVLAAYSIVANDAIQTLGTFLSSNAKRQWWVLWLYATGILTAVMLYTYFANDGDLTYGRLGSLFQDYPRGRVTWLHVIPPALILLMTRFGWPVSTTFLVLTVFAHKALGKMLMKSLIGYGLAFGLAIVIYLVVTKLFEKRCIDTRHQPTSPLWVVLQWVSTAWLWAQWLIQDLANIFVFLPFTRTVDAEGNVSTQFSLGWLLFSLVLMWGIQAFIFYSRGGEIQKIVTSKTNTTDIRSATVIDFLYGTILFIFKQWSNVPMSTTWVFIGLLAGRELAMTIHRVALRTPREIAKSQGRRMTAAERKTLGTDDQEASSPSFADYVCLVIGAASSAKLTQHLTDQEICSPACAFEFRQVEEEVDSAEKANELYLSYLAETDRDPTHVEHHGLNTKQMEFDGQSFWVVSPKRVELPKRSLLDTLRIVGFDAAKAGAGLAVSVALAFGLPMLYAGITGEPLVPQKKDKTAQPSDTKGESADQKDDAQDEPAVDESPAK